MYSLSLGMLLPLVRKLPFSLESDVAASAPVEFINAGTYHFSNIVDNPQELGFAWDYHSLLLTIYAIGLVFFAFRMFYGLFKILRIWNESEKIQKGEYTLVVMDIDQLPFSFFKNVFISKSFLQRDYIQKVLEHELVHIKHRHTYDVFAVQILSIIFWWNPLIYIFRKALKETHEYLADAYACLDSDIKNYGLILLGQSSSGIELALTNQFFNSLLKKRINMLNREKSAGYKMSKYLLAIPLLCFMVILFSASTLQDSNEPQESERVHPVLKKIENDKLRLALVKDFDVLYQKSQEKGEALEESKEFYKLFKIYQKQYANDELLIEEFKSIACSFGIKILFPGRESTNEGFQTFMYVVPKHNFKAWKQGEMPEYDEMVCGPNSVPAPPMPPVPDFAGVYESSNAPLLIVEGEIIEPPYNDKFDYRVRHDLTTIPAEVAVEKYGDKGKHGAHIIEYNYPTFGVNDVSNGILQVGNKYKFSITRYGGLKGELTTNIGHTDYYTTSPNDIIVFSIDEMTENGTIDIEYKVGDEVITRNYLLVEDEIEEVIEESLSPIIGMESPKDNILFIDMKNTIKLKTFNVETKKVRHVIAKGPEYFRVKNVINDFNDSNNFIVDIEALKETPITDPCEIKFIFDDGNQISKKFHVRKQGYTEEEIVEEEVDVISAESIKIDLNGKVEQKQLTLHNGVEIDLDEGAVISLDGHMIHYDKEEGLKEFGEKGTNGVLDLVGEITITKPSTQQNNDEFFFTKESNFQNSDKLSQDPLSTIEVVEESLEKDPLVIINGEISDKESMDKINPDDIISVDILKGDKAKAEYGEKAKNGVVKIVTNDNVSMEQSKSNYLIKGKVIDAESGKPLIGANVIVEGIKQGTITDLNGEYQLKVKEGRHNIVASYIGYKTLDSKVKQECQLDFELVKEDNFLLSTDNKKNSKSGVKIRADKKGSSDDPLFVIDGVVVPNANFENLNPKDIKEISVFKKEEDIKKYGKRGKNGVVEITTKNGDYKVPTGNEEGLPLNLKDPKPLILIDGDEKTEAELEALDPDKIATMNIFKGDQAIEEFGEKGKNDVISVVTKKVKENIIVLRVVNGIKEDKSTEQKNDISTKTYSLSPAVAKEKANIETDADLVDFIFTEDNHALENKMPLKFKLLENPVVGGAVRFEYTTDSFDDIQATVVTSLGQKIKGQKIAPTSNVGTSSIELSGLTPGMYILNLQANGVSVTEQFILAN